MFYSTLEKKMVGQLETVTNNSPSTCSLQLPLGGAKCLLQLSAACYWRSLQWGVMPINKRTFFYFWIHQHSDCSVYVMLLHCVFLHCLRGSRLVHLLLGERTTTGKVEEETDPIKINLYLQGVHHFQRLKNKFMLAIINFIITSLNTHQILVSSGLLNAKHNQLSELVNSGQHFLFSALVWHGYLFSSLVL